MNTFNFKINPFKTNFLKTLLILIAFFSLLTAIDPSGQISSFLALFPGSFAKKYFWQFATYIFLLPHPSISTGFILRLAINLYIFWFCSTFIIKWKGSLQLFFFILSVTLASACLALALMPFFPMYLFGLNILICSIAIAWLILAGDLRFHVFNFNFKAKWMVINLIFARILYNLFLGFYLTSILDLSAVIFSYFYALIIWQHKSPFLSLSHFEKPLTRLFKKKIK